LDWFVFNEMIYSSKKKKKDSKTAGDFIFVQTQQLTKPIYFSRLTQQLGLGLAL
jgi:hypothetical protein